MERSYRVGILGFGFIGKVHAYSYAVLPFYYDPPPLTARITHVATSRRETAEKARQTIGAEVAVTDYRAITENPQIDIVHVCSPNHAHKEALLSAMRHGKHIYCDKPLVATLDEAEAVRAAQKDYRGVAQMTFQNRFFPATMRAKQLIQSGAVGKVLEFRAMYLHGGSANPAAPFKWKLSAAAGGGVIADLASHVLDLVDWLLGPFRSILAASQIAYPQRPSEEDPARKIPVDTEDCVMLLAKMESGAMGTLEATKLATGSEDELRLEIHGAGRDPLQPDGRASPGILRRDGVGPAARRFPWLEPHRRRPALSVARRYVSKPEGQRGLAPRARSLPGQFSASGSGRTAGNSGIRARNSRPATHGVRPCVGGKRAVGDPALNVAICNARHAECMNRAGWGSATTNRSRSSVSVVEFSFYDAVAALLQVMGTPCALSPASVRLSLTITFPTS